MAYIVLTHTRPAQVTRLAQRLAGPGTRILVHVDRHAPPGVFREMRLGMERLPGVTFLRRFGCHWGGFGPVRATLEGIRVLVEDDVPFDHALLLSGQDYPIKPRAALERLLAEAGGRSFMDVTALPSERFARGGLERVDRWHWHGRVLGRRVRFPNRFVPVRIPRRPPPLPVFAGSAYWCLTRECLEHIHGYVDANPWISDVFRHASCPDEGFFQTIVANGPHAGSVITHNLHHVDWSQRRSSPRVLTSSDLEVLAASPAMFARKFDQDVDAAILDPGDPHLLGAEAPRPG